jgi:hypothetical protein
MKNNRFPRCLSAAVAGFIAGSSLLAGSARADGTKTEAAARSLGSRMPLFVSMTNGTDNALVVYSSASQFIASYPTGGAGGAAGNGGAVQTQGDLVALPDFGSNDVAVFTRSGDDFELAGRVATASSPVSLAFGATHLYVLEADRVESFPINGDWNNKTADGSVPELIGDGSAGQIGYLTDGHLIYTEKTGAVAEVQLSASGSVIGSSHSVANLPASLNTPLGLATRGAVALVTSAHDLVNQEMLIVAGAAITSSGRVTGLANGTGVFPNDADCWNIFFGPFAYSADSPGHKLDLYTLTGSGHLAFDSVATTFSGAPTDLGVSHGGLLGVIRSGNLSTFQIDSAGQLTPLGTAETGPLNGAAWSE